MQGRLAEHEQLKIGTALAIVVWAGSCFWPVAAASDDPALGLDLSGARYRLVLGLPPAAGLPVLND